MCGREHDIAVRLTDAGLSRKLHTVCAQETATIVHVDKDAQ